MLLGEFVWNKNLGPGIPEAKDSLAAKNLTGVDEDVDTKVWIPGANSTEEQGEKGRGGGDT